MPRRKKSTAPSSGSASDTGQPQPVNYRSEATCSVCGASIYTGDYRIVDIVIDTPDRIPLNIYVHNACKSTYEGSRTSAN